MATTKLTKDLTSSLDFPCIVQAWGWEDSPETSLDFYINRVHRSLRFNFLEINKEMVCILECLGINLYSIHILDNL